MTKKQKLIEVLKELGVYIPYGTITIRMQDGVPVLIEKTEKVLVK